MTSTRILGPITILLALLTTWALYGRGWMAGPLALCFVVLAFWWHIQRPAPTLSAAEQRGNAPFA